MTFTYEASTREGRVVTGRIDAGDRLQARSELRRRRLYPLRIHEAAASAGTGGARAALERWRAAIRSKGTIRLDFTRELSTLLSAGFSLDRSLALLAEILPPVHGRTVVLDVRARLREGGDLSSALAGHREIFPDMYIRLVEAGETSGSLVPVFERLTRQLERRAEIRERIRSALIYPALMASVGSLAVAILLIVVLPKFVEILQSSGGALPWTTRILVGGGEIIGRFWWAFLAVIGLAAAGLERYRRTDSGERRLAAWTLRLPVWGGLIRSIATARFARTLGMSLESGMALLPAMESASETVDNPVVRESLDRVRVRVREGEGIAASIDAESALLPGLAVQMIRVGEEGGRLPVMLEKVAELFEQKAERRIERLVTLIEPALILFFGLVVGFVAYAMLQAIFGIQRAPL